MRTSAFFVGPSAGRPFCVKGGCVLPVVQSLGQIASLEPAWSPSSSSTGSLRLYDQYAYDYSTLYRTQSNVRTVVDFLARNIAQLGLHVFERVSDTDRRRLTDHPLAQLIARPNHFTTRYQLIEDTIIDLGVYANAYWLKVRQEPLQLLRIPPELLQVHGYIMPTVYEITLADKTLKVAPSDVVHFRDHGAGVSQTGMSPLETLRRILAEEHAMGDYREDFWRNAARMHGIIERPKDAANWSQQARERFKQEFEALYSGFGNSAKTAVLEDGMTWKPGAFNAQESEYLAGRKLTREEVARAYHVPLPMVGILDHATFSNIAEQHKNLYQDCLGPRLKMLEEVIELQLLSEFEDTGIYVEFNIAEKLAGSFEEQAASLQSAVGRPWMTANEARARQNLPSLGGDADQLVTPLNVLVGGQASPRDSAPPKGLNHGFKAVDTTHIQMREQHRKRWAEVLTTYFRRQEAAIVSRVPAKAAKGISDVWGDGRRWDSELRDDLLRLNVLTAGAWAKRVADEVDTEVDPDLMLPWLEENSRIAAEEINATTRTQIAEALGEDEPLTAARHVFEVALAARVFEIATSKVTTAANFGAHEAAHQSNLKSKTWRVNSGNPRPAHAAMDGETVGIGDTFSNGMLWPGDPAGGADENAGCQCSVSFGSGSFGR